MHRPKNNRRERKDFRGRLDGAFLSVEKKLGAERVAALSQKWKSLRNQKHGLHGDRDLADSMLVCLLNLSLSHVEIRSI